MKKLIKTEGTEFEQNLKDLAIIETTDRAGKPVMIDSTDFNAAYANGESGAKALIDVGQVETEEKTVAAGTATSLVITPTSGKDAMTKVTITGINAADIKKDVVLFGVTGTYEGE